MASPTRPEDRAKASAAAASASWAQVAQEVDSVEADLHALRGQYEQYFLGMEKRPPVRAHEAVQEATRGAEDGALAQLVAVVPDPVAAGLHGDVRAALGADDPGDRGRDLPPRRLQGAAPAEELLARAARGCPPRRRGAGRRSAREVAAPLPPRSQPPLPAQPTIHIAGTAPPEPLSENRLRSVYRAYVEAKRRCNEDTTRLSFDAVAASLKRQVPELLERHNARDVEYRVFVKDGKAILRAVPKL